MPKPVIIAKRAGPDWMVHYTDHDTGEPSVVTVFGSPTIDDALKEARFSLDALHQNWYTITQIELVSDDPPK